MVSITTIYCFQHDNKVFVLMKALTDYAFVSLLLPEGVETDVYVYPSATAEKAIQKAEIHGHTITEFVVPK